ncbi:MAG: hypothetical protein Q9163_002270 [Psora crenata]
MLRIQKAPCPIYPARRLILIRTQLKIKMHMATLSLTALGLAWLMVMFKDPGNHEAAVYVSGLNKIILQRLIIDLNTEPPTLHDDYLSDPPIFAPSGAAYHNGLIYFAADGSTDNTTLGGGTFQRAGIKTLDPFTNKSKTLLNNYFGLLFTSPNDLITPLWLNLPSPSPPPPPPHLTLALQIPSSAHCPRVMSHPQAEDPAIDVDSTAYTFSFPSFTIIPPQLESAVFRFRPCTGAVQMVEGTLKVPNGIGLSLGLKTLYIGDIGALSGSHPGKRTIYAYDLSSDGTYIMNKRAIYLAQEFVADGFKVAGNGYLVTATGHGADMLDAHGILLLRIQTSFSVQGVVFAGNDLKELWLMGTGAIARVQWALQGPALT